MKKEIKDTVLEIINRCIDGDIITLKQMNADLSELGMDSISFVHIVVALEEEFNCEIPDEKLIISEMNTVKKIIAVLQLIIKKNNTQQET